MTVDRPRLYTSTLLDVGIFKASEQHDIDARYVNSDLDLDGVASSTIGTKTQDHQALYEIKHFQNALKGFTCIAVYEQEDNDDDAYDKDELRVRLSYGF